MIATELRPNTVSSDECEDVYAFSDSEDSRIEDEQLTSSCPISIRIPECLLVSPRSFYEPFEPPFPIVRECRALEMLLPQRSDEDEYLELQLEDFTVYSIAGTYAGEMRALNQLDTSESQCLYFDGVLSNGAQSAYVRGVCIHALPIGNYGRESRDATRDKIWFQSKQNATKEIFYKLGTPAMEYKRFFEPFLWVADLAKHFVDFLTAMRDGNQAVTIHHFRRDFATWLLAAYAESDKIEDIRTWMSKYPRLDYRSAVNTNIAFLYKEFVGVWGLEDADFHLIWNEVFHYQKYIPYHADTESSHTIVTKYVYDCFSRLPFGGQLKAVDFGATTTPLRSRLIAQRSLPPFHMPARTSSRDISPGDTISTTRDTGETGTVWEKEAARDDRYADLWFALVQRVSFDRDGHRIFEVIWYYRPVDTLCGLMKYPWPNELFLSDHCSCDENSKIREDQVSGVHQVDFGGTPETAKEFFCRQFYLVEDKIWISLTQAHLRCSCTNDARVSNMAEYNPGDTVLVHLSKDSDICEPCEIVSAKKYGATLYVFRKLSRRHKIDSTAGHAPPNELVYTDETVKHWSSRIVARCHIRWFAANTTIPTPYDRDGVGAFFFFAYKMEQVGDGHIITPLEEAPSSLRQGYDPRRSSVPKLRGLDLFCGGGNFGRGLEEGGSVMMNWANDMDEKALHTYMANTTDPDQVSPFLGSIDDFQRLAIEGRFSHNVPRVGEVDFISGGSPCPGFSSLTNDRTTDAQRKNQSLVAAFASCVDVYRPKYGILENVPLIIQNKQNKDQDVFSQLICALVGMGYQARLFFLDAISYGAAQLRSRVFVVFAAPGWKLPEKPLQTHSYQANVKKRSLGRLPTGEPMAKREIPKCTPFRYKSASQAAAGLPTIYDAKPDICVPFPDHRVVSNTNTMRMRRRMCLIPKFPHGMNFSQAWYGYYGTKGRAAGNGVLTKAQRDIFPDSNLMVTSIKSNAYGRQPPSQPMSAITTTANAGDAKQGRTIHWSEDRCLTVLEAKRAQGFLDEEILLGPTATQYKIVGNSVARGVSLALGAAIADAVLRSHGDHFEELAIDGEDDEKMEETSPFWEEAQAPPPLGSAEPETTPETSVPGSPGAAAPPAREEDGGSNKRRRLE